MDMNISLDVLKKYGACDPGIECFKYLKTRTLSETINKCMDLSDDVVLQWTDDKLNKYRWCSWLLSRILPKDENIKYAIYSARLVIDIFEKKYPNDNRPRKAIEAAELYLEGKVTKEQIGDAAYAAACAAADAAYAAAYAAYAAKYAAYAAKYAAYAADVAYAAKYAAYAADVAYAADAAAIYAADAAANYADRKEMFRSIITYGLTLIEEQDKTK
jgi:hypothetical protein